MRKIRMKKKIQKKMKIKKIWKLKKKRPTSVCILLQPPEDNKYREKFDKIRGVVEEYGKEEEEEE